MLDIFHKKVGAKIALGYLLTLAFLLGIGALSIARLDHVSATVADLTSRLEVDRQLSSDILLRSQASRFYAARYVQTRKQIDLDQFDEEFNSLKKLLEQADKELTDPERAALLDTIQQDVQAYGDAFARIVTLIHNQQKTQTAVMDVQDMTLENKLTALRVHINNLNDPLVFLAFGNAQNASKNLRLNVLLYMSENDERYTVLIEKNYRQTLESFTNLQDALTDPQQRQNAADARAASATYYQGFQSIHASTLQMQQVFQNQLNTLDPQISQSAAKMDASLQQEFERRSRSSQSLVAQTRRELILVTLGAILSSIVLGIFLSRRITLPLHQVMQASKQIANTDLQNLTRQLNTLAGGDVRINLDVTTQPLTITVQDEVGQMAQAFNQIIMRLHEAETAFDQMSSYLQEMAAAAQNVTQGNLQIQLEPCSADDILGNTILNMFSSLRQAQQQVQLQLERLETLRHIDTMISTNQELSHTLQFLVKQACQHLDMEAGEIYLVDPRTQQIDYFNRLAYFQASSNKSQISQTDTSSCAMNIAASKQRLLIPDIAQSEHWAEYYQHFRGWNAYVGVPLITQQEPVGVLQLFKREALQPADTWLNFLETLAGQAAIAITNAQLVRGLEERVNIRTHELDEARRFSQAILLSSPVAIVVTNLNNRITGWNPAAEKMFGYSFDEAAGSDLDELITSPAYRQEALELTQKTCTGNEIVRAFTRRSRKDGSLVEVEVAGIPVIVDDQRVAVLAIYHDITELQNARQLAEEATRAKSAFLAMMSHEIRTPMNGVIGMTSLLLDTHLTPKQRDFVETIRQSGESLLVIINDILDYSKIEAGRMDLEYQPFSLSECIESALDLVAQSAARKNLELAYLPGHQIPQAIYGDATRLRQILVNLLSNAIKFTEHGEVVVSILAENLLSSSLIDTNEVFSLHFMVRDTGIGIPPDRKDLLFRSFSQLDASTTRKYGGTGLGLAICKRLVEMMGGEIWVESAGQQGNGATFHFTIQTRQAIGLPQQETTGPLPSLAEKRILVVDDNATNRQVLTHMTHAWGILPTVVASGREALAWIDRQTPFDAAILDVQMPEMDGLTLAVEISKRQPNSIIPIIILTSLGRREEIPPGLQIAAYLYKPIKASSLYNTLVNIFVHSECPTPTPAHHDESALKPFETNLGVRHPLRILLAEDHVVNQKVALSILERIGYRADVAANGIEVLQAFDRQDYDVVLMDVQMPEMDGIETTRRLRSDLPPERQPYIIAITANVLPGDREQYLETGMNDYLGKPIQVTQLQHSLKNCRSLGGVSIAEEDLTLTIPTEQPENILSESLKLEEPAIDRQALDEYFPGWQEDPNSLAEMIDMLLQDTSQRLQVLRQSIQQGQIENVWRTAHAIKGASLTFGAQHFSILCKDLEMIGKSGTLQNAEQKLSEIEVEYGRVQTELLRLVGKEN